MLTAKGWHVMELQAGCLTAALDEQWYKVRTPCATVPSGQRPPRAARAAVQTF